MKDAGFISAGKIAVSAISLASRISAMKTSSDYIQGSALKIDNLSSCSGINMQGYIDFSREMSKMIDKYRELISKDLNDLEKSKKALMEADKNAANLLRTVTDAAKKAISSGGGSGAFGGGGPTGPGSGGGFRDSGNNSGGGGAWGSGGSMGSR